jgi:hypothetical protein
MITVAMSRATISQVLAALPTAHASTWWSIRP